jgi:hypothetical protein
MPELCIKRKSPRHGIVFDRVPTIKGSIWGGSFAPYCPATYGQILDCVVDMADQIATANAWTYDHAIEKVLADEGWRLLPTHTRKIIKILEA